MFFSVFDIKIGIGPSSSHTTGQGRFLRLLTDQAANDLLSASGALSIFPIMYLHAPRSC